MTISARTPEGSPSHCPICGAAPNLEFSDPASDAPCPSCGCLVWNDGEIVVRLRGPILTAEALDEVIVVLTRWADSQQQPRIRLDLQDVTYIASAALGKLIRNLIQRRKGLANRNVRLSNIHPDLMEIFRITRLDQVLRLD